MMRFDEAPVVGNRPAILAGSLVQALHDMQELGLQALSVPAILKRLSVSRSQAYEWAQRHRNWREARPGPGRPQKEASLSTQTELQSLRVVEATRDFLMTHPGAACPGAKRMVYSDEFRSYVLDLATTNTESLRLTQEQLAKACGIPLHTLVSWLAGGRLAAAAEKESCAPVPEQAVASNAPDSLQLSPADVPTPPEEASLPTAKWAAGATQVLELWTKWRGKFGAFCATLPGHGIHMSPSLVRSILAVSGKRPQRPRRGRNLDAEAIRGELVRLFPNAQWNADGKTLRVLVGDQAFHFNLELAMDTASTAHLGFSLRDHEDSQGLLSAYDQATVSAGGTPLGQLRDARKCNLSEAIETRLREDGVISMVSTIRRPQNNAPVEYEFSLMGHKLPVPALPPPETLSAHDLGRLVLAYMLLGVTIGRNHTPRSRLKTLTPAEAFAQSRPTEQQKLDARERLTKLRNNVRARAQADRLRCKPAALAMAKQGIQDLGLNDPKGLIAPAIAHWGLDATLEATAAFRAKQQAGTLPDDHHERYLLGIARNTAFRDEDMRVYEELLRLRARAGDLVLAPLLQHDLHLRETLSASDYISAAAKLALQSEAPVDRSFWRRRTLSALGKLPPQARHELARRCAQTVAGKHSVPHRERDFFIAELARVVVPLAA